MHVKLSRSPIVASIATMTLLLAACAPAAAPAPAPAAPAAPTAPTAAPAPTPTPAILRPVPIAPTPAPAAAPATPTPSSAARRGGVMVAYTTDLGRTLDPAQESSAVNQPVFTSAFNRLTRIDASRLPRERVLIGDLAQSWEAKAGGTEWTFKLREGVAWSDGKPFSSADVKATLDRILKPTGGIKPTFTSVLKVISAVDTPDARTVVIKTSKPAPWLGEVLMQPPASIVPAHIVAADQRALENKPLGTGPFAFKDWRKGVSVEWTRNDNYWNKPYPYLDGVKWIEIKEASTQFAAFRTGRVHFTGFATRGLEVSEIRTLKKEMPDAHISEYSSTSIWILWMNNKSGPFKDVRVRQAVAKAVNQKEVIEIALEGAGFQSDFSGDITLAWALPKAEQDKIPAIRGPNDKDIAEAKALMKDAGYGNGLAVNWLVGDRPVYVSRHAVLSDQLSKIGIKSTTKTAAYPSEYVPALRDGKFDMSDSAAVAAMYDPSALLDPWMKGGLENRSGFEDAKIAELYDKQSSLTDPLERKKLMDQAQLRLWELAPSVPISIAKYYLALRPEVQGWTHPGVLRDNYMLETIWFKQ